MPYHQDPRVDPDQRNFQMDRRRTHDEHLVLAIAAAVAEKVARTEPVRECLSTDEQQWVKLAIAREAQSIKLRQAIIEKTLAGLVWAALAGLAVLVAEYVKNHGWKP